MPSDDHDRTFPDNSLSPIAWGGVKALGLIRIATGTICIALPGLYGAGIVTRKHASLALLQLVGAREFAMGASLLTAGSDKCVDTRDPQKRYGDVCQHMLLYV
jgi:hypothetical protein